MMSDQAGHQPLNHELLVEVAMHHQLHRFRALRHRDADMKSLPPGTGSEDVSQASITRCSSKVAK